MRKKTILVFVFILFVCQAVFGQKSGAVLQFGVTGTGYYGDLNAGEGSVFTANYFSVSPGLELGLQPAQWGRIAPQIRVGYGRFQSQDPDATTNPPDPIDTPDGVIIPNSFADVTLPYLVIGLEGRLFRSSRSFTPLLSAGLRIQSFSSRNEEGIPLAQLWTTRLPEERTLPSLAPSFDIGFGLEKRINKRLRFSLIYHHIIVGSDYLDNLGKLGRQAGNDKLHSLRLSLGFDLGEGAGFPVRKKKAVVEPEKVMVQEAVYDPALGKIQQPKVKKRKIKPKKVKKQKPEKPEAVEPKVEEPQTEEKKIIKPKKKPKIKEPKAKKEKKVKKTRVKKAKTPKSRTKEKKDKEPKKKSKTKEPKPKKEKLKKKKDKEKSQESEEGL